MAQRFLARILEDAHRPGRKVAQLEPGEVAEYRAAVQAFGLGEQVTLSVEPYEPERTLDQNGYFHAEPLRKWMKGEPDFAGLSPAQAKLVLLGMHFGWEQAPSGQWIPVKSSTSELTKPEFTGFIDWLIIEGNSRGINVVPPERDPARRDRRVKVA